MTKIEQRIARLEAKMGGSGASTLTPDLRINPMMNPDGIVTSCMVLPEQVLSGMEAFYSHQQWRHRDTCPDADTCQHASHCEAGGDALAAAIQRMTMEELDTFVRVLDSHQGVEEIEQLPDDAKAIVCAIIDSAAARPEPPPWVPSYQRVTWEDGAWVIDRTYRGVGQRAAHRKTTANEAPE